MLDLNCNSQLSGAGRCNLDYPCNPLFSSDVCLRCSVACNRLGNRGI
jgi:hypothetical protein